MTDHRHPRCVSASGGLLITTSDTTTIDRLRARIADLEDRIATIASEAFGPFPVQTPEENMTAIERGIFCLRQRSEAKHQRILVLEAQVDELMCWLAGDYADGELHEERKAAFEQHLVRCDKCRLAVVEQIELTTRIAAAAREDLRAADMAAAALTSRPTPCTDFCPPTWTSHWREWHRGHGCNLDDGKSR